MEQSFEGNKDGDAEAIRAYAEEKARHEGHEVTDDDIAFYAEILHNLRQEGKNDLADKMAESGLKSHEIKTEMGPGLYALYTQVQEELEPSITQERNENISELLSKNLPFEQENMAVGRISNESVLQLIAGIRVDQRVIDSFEGREALLDKALKLMEESLMV